MINIKEQSISKSHKIRQKYFCIFVRFISNYLLQYMVIPGAVPLFGHNYEKTRLQNLSFYASK